MLSLSVSLGELTGAGDDPVGGRRRGRQVNIIPSAFLQQRGLSISGDGVALGCVFAPASEVRYLQLCQAELGSEGRHHGSCFIVRPFNPRHHHMVISTVGTSSIVGFRGRKRSAKSLAESSNSHHNCCCRHVHKAKKRRAREATNEATSPPPIQSLGYRPSRIADSVPPLVMIIGKLMTPTCVVEYAGR